MAGPDINHIKLPSRVIADLYHTSLVDTGETPVPQAGNESTEIIPATTAGWKWLGENRKNILVIVRYRDAVYLPDHDLDFLTGILSACKLNLADVAIVNLDYNTDASFKQLSAFFSSRVVLLFDVEPESFGLPMRFPHFQIQPFGGNTFLFSPALKELENDKLLKSKLWVCLKRLFNL